MCVTGWVRGHGKLVAIAEALQAGEVEEEEQVWVWVRLCGLRGLGRRPARGV